MSQYDIAANRLMFFGLAYGNTLAEESDLMVGWHHITIIRGIWVNHIIFH